VVAEGDRVGGFSRPQFRVDRFQYPVQVAADVRIPKSQHAKSVARQVLVAQTISRSMAVEIMLPAVNFNGEFVLEAHEVDDIPEARHLTSKVISAGAP